MQAHIKRVEAAMDALKKGKMVILTDHHDRENEGDLIFAAEFATAENVNFMLRHGSGVVCLALPRQHLQKLNLPLMVPLNESRQGTGFTISIEARSGITTGVSAVDRAHTILTAISETSVAEDLVRPGHVFPLQAQDHGVLERAGHTEGSIDLVRMAGLTPAAVLCEVMNSDGTMTHGEQLEVFSQDHDIMRLSIEDVIVYRYAHENLIATEASATLPLESFGEFKITAIEEKITGKEHIVLTKPSKNAKDATLVRIHSSCVTGDLFASQRCDCRQQLLYSLEEISKVGGVLIYLSQEGRGIGILNKIKAYSLQEKGMDTIEANECLGFQADGRHYYIAANVLKNLNITQVKLLTNNPAKLAYLKLCGIDQVEQIPLPAFCNPQNQHYLQTKIQKMNHTFANDFLHQINGV
ncbi:MAG: 3,4-dihydroxy-2-butanone-4-phosphate synthase [Gammaproteobacteria bacterium]|nr:3,4-dihydroxy-2-butanone-4-phosphate synthase [Gammaproteobacteria bacterium]